ncbi:MAG: 2OG-Fe(II) oxygenase [Actinomycetota bacterium]|nr:2OG-Fe(II) oxygenase [Actinomycetota bacterium]
MPIAAARTPGVTAEIRKRVDALDWDQLTDRLNAEGHAVTPTVLNPDECGALGDLFDQGRFRSTVDMARHRFGDGRYRYFDHPLPETIAALRSSFYPHLAAVANRWSELLRGNNPTFPTEHQELLARCHSAGQNRLTPLILRYQQGDWNALHQDLYGEVVFPFQILTILSRRGQDFDGGEFVLLEQRPRAQSRAHVLSPPQGAFVIFPTAERPNRGANGYHRIGMRHGVSTVTQGKRTALGVIFHDAS